MDQRSLIQSILPTLLLLVATIGGWIAKPIDFGGKPPVAAGEAATTAGSLQTVETRLWKDPFAGLPNKAQLAEEKFHKTALEGLGPLRELLAERNDRGQQRAVLVVFAHAGSGSYETESRVRQRHAVLAGLGMGGYVPVDENRIGLLAAPWERPRLRKPGEPLFGAFETFEPANSRQASIQHPGVVVLWVPENEFQDGPVARLAQLMDGLGRGVDNSFPLLVLGPRTTGGLFAFCEEAERAAKEGVRPAPRRPGTNEAVSAKEALGGAQIYSAWATTTDELLPPYAEDTPRDLRGREGLRRRLGELGVAFHDFAADDRELARELTRELKLRGVDYSEHDKILLLSEWHTDYGRALPLTFAANWAAPRELAPPRNAQPERGAPGVFSPNENFGRNVRAIQEDPAGRFPAQLLKVSYLAGVDGDQRAGGAKAGGDGKDKAEAGARAAPAAPDAARYAAFGESQFDYMERLARRLDGDFGGFERRTGQGHRVVAIGVLGSDFYDKLRLIQALRPKFPQALFFTTDLDARMLSTDTRPWMRNLLVASSWGLEPDDMEQDPRNKAWHARIPPFRDSYQTAAYQALRKALAPEGAIGAVPAAKVFEIGRTRPVRLPAVRGRDEVLREGWLRLGLFFLLGAPLAVGIARGRGRIRELYRRHAYRRRLWIAGAFTLLAFSGMAWWRSPNGMLLLCLGVLVLGGLYVFGLPSREPRQEAGAPHPFAAALSGLGVVAALALAAWAVVPGAALRAEPFHWLEGVSLWPAEMVRVAAGLLAVYWIFATHREVLEMGRALTERYALATDEAISPAGGGSAVSAREAWQAYRARLAMGGAEWAHGPLRCSRWVKIGTGVLMLFWLYFTYWQPEPLRAPYRGEFSRWADVAVVLFVMTAYTVLLLQVFDVSRRTRAFIHELAQKPTAWPAMAVRDRVDAEVLKSVGGHLDGWLDVKFVAELTHTVGNLVIRPFVILFLLLAATTHDFFDLWSMNQPYIITLSVVNASLPLLCGFFLCREAEKAREAAAARLRGAMLNSREPETGRYRQMLAEIVECRKGAFRPIYEQPYVIALLIPLGGSGGIEILRSFLVR